MLKKLLIILASALIIFSCFNEFPKDHSYSIATHAPDWMQKDFTVDETGNFGLIDWFGWQDSGIQYHMMSMDYKDEGGELDGICDTIVIMMEYGDYDNRHGSPAPLLMGVTTVECEKWDEMTKRIIDDLKSKGA
jgi:hypothetical protein